MGTTTTPPANLDVQRVWELLHEMGHALQIITPGVRAIDGGQQAVLGSTNHMDLLRDLKGAYDDYQFETSDYGPGEEYPGDDAILGSHEED